MANQTSSTLSRLGRQLACVGLAVAVAGCSTTQTTLSVRSTPQAPSQRIRLVRPDTVTGQWHQEGRSLTGQLSFVAACQAETVQVTRREQVKDTHANPRYSTGAYVAGALISLVGVAILASSADKDDTVSCGNGDTPHAGDTCDSEAGAWRALGAVTLGSGLGAILGGAIVQRAHRAQRERSAHRP